MNWRASALRGSTHPTETAFIDPIILIARLQWLRIVLEAEGSLMTAQVRAMRDRKGRVYTPAVGPRLRPLLWIILISFAVLGANGFYLASVTALTWHLGTTQQTFFYMLMVILHLVLGFLLIVPFLTF